MDDEDDAGDGAEQAKRRQIPGELVYTTTPGTLRSVLNAMVQAEQPERFSQDFLTTILGFKGGSARAQLPVLKRLGFLRAEGSPTDIYSRFRSDTGRASAAYDALRSGYATLFQRNTHVYRASTDEVRDLIVQITGLKRDDAIVSNILSTFETIRSYLPNNYVATGSSVAKTHTDADFEEVPPPTPPAPPSAPTLGLAYNINIVLPPSNTIDTYNLVFRSLRENILDWQK